MSVKEKQGTSLARAASEAFRKGDYAAALKIYRQLSTLLGERNFQANVFLCEKRLYELSGLNRSANASKLLLTLTERRPLAEATHPLKSLKVAAIMDEFTHSSYKYECDLLQLSPQHWRKELEEFQPQLLFIESAWRGKDELWGSKVGHTSPELRGIVQWCKQHAIPTVFWNKEDPVHFETFLNTAKLFDHVFTTDIDCIHRYKAALGHERVYLLPFAAQPAVNNPIELYERKDAICFAGAYYVKYPERTKDLVEFVRHLPQFKPFEIFDRNYGRSDPSYAFPDDYKPYIVGKLPFDQIDRAYKGYFCSINLNSVKQSQTMFARRVFELLASNTITVSNYSRGIRLLFEDLVITTDSGAEAVRRLKELTADETKSRKLRLAALRKVMAEHTYQDRLAYVASKALNKPGLDCLLPQVAVVCYANDQEKVQRLLRLYHNQEYSRKRLLMVVPGGFQPQLPLNMAGVEVLNASAVASKTWSEVLLPGEWLAPMVPEDHYGAHYLTDLVLATRYAPGPIIGKASHYVRSEATGLWLKDRAQAYKKVPGLLARAAMVRGEHVATAPVREWITTLHTARLEHPDALSIDEFNYCRNAGMEGLKEEERAETDNLPGLSTGIRLDALIQRAEAIQPLAAQDEGPALSPGELSDLFAGQPSHKPVQISQDDRGLRVQSELPDDTHEYVYARRDLDLQALGITEGGRLRFYLDATPGLNLQVVWLFLDGRGKKLGHVVKVGNRNHEVDIPAETAKLRLGLRVYGPGGAQVKSLLLAHRALEPAELITTGDYLVLTNHYPSANDLYRNGFVHRRVVAYRERGVKADVFRLRPGEQLSYHEFENVDCLTGSAEALDRLLATGRYRAVLVHFLDPGMWQVLERHVRRQRIIVWVHGAEIQPFHRREYNYRTDKERAAAQAKSDARMAFWRGLLKTMPPNLHLVFVSRYFAEEVMEDLGFRLPESHFSIIHNPIDTRLFTYEPKPPEQRKKVLSIRPYASATYANDLSVKAITELKDRSWFSDVEFRLIGDGVLFEETLAPLRGLSNVHLERRFLTQQEIASLHRTYGIFLCPTRMDTQGVSRDEAMASGLVPVTNAVAAIPEFVDEGCGVLAPAEDHLAMAQGIENLVLDPDRFQQMSAAAAARVRRQSDASVVIDAELKILGAEDASHNCCMGM
ncbi:glycosyltransferase family protein [Rehaibacterium terrae]|uniref:Spore maturation protein CgeB/glycosyltransferase involved in cell wall biosynthesis n=1 Tax=Rehaibacterium terrae TaxID=1341696 RepID=A0A7W7V8V6_9GAMM|nr:glycosyltransferase [Rehaibacterium terrae]MBB5014461.1 spore maturation protein CgeB/glycosyltransferase involved in cell wall biosynthesis [Rehaibacterium terrae]